MIKTHGLKFCISDLFTIILTCIYFLDGLKKSYKSRILTQKSLTQKLFCILTFYTSIILLSISKKIC